jgi:hypothetical protein
VQQATDRHDRIEAVVTEPQVVERHDLGCDALLATKLDIAR